MKVKKQQRRSSPSHNKSSNSNGNSRSSHSDAAKTIATATAAGQEQSSMAVVWTCLRIVLLALVVLGGFRMAVDAVAAVWNAATFTVLSIVAAICVEQRIHSRFILQASSSASTTAVNAPSAAPTPTAKKNKASTAAAAKPATSSRAVNGVKQTQTKAAGSVKQHVEGKEKEKVVLPRTTSSSRKKDQDDIKAHLEKQSPAAAPAAAAAAAAAAPAAAAAAPAAAAAAPAAAAAAPAAAAAAPAAAAAAPATAANKDNFAVRTRKTRNNKKAVSKLREQPNVESSVVELASKVLQEKPAEVTKCEKPVDADKGKLLGAFQDNLAAAASETLAVLDPNVTTAAAAAGNQSSLVDKNRDPPAADKAVVAAASKVEPLAMETQATEAASIIVQEELEEPAEVTKSETPVDADKDKLPSALEEDNLAAASETIAVLDQRVTTAATANQSSDPPAAEDVTTSVNPVDANDDLASALEDNLAAASEALAVLDQNVTNWLVDLASAAAKQEIVVKPNTEDKAWAPEECPTELPSKPIRAASVTPKKAFESYEELVRAVDDYLSNNMDSKAAGTLKYGATIADWDVSKIKSFRALFSASRNMRAADFNGDISAWDVSGGFDFSNMFNGALRFNGDLSKWNVSNARDMELMFSKAESFNSDIGEWDVSNVNNMSSMFARASAFNQDLSKWNVSRVTNMTAMFSEAKSFQGMGLDKWNVSNVMDMTYMFYWATCFHCDLSKWDISKVSAMAYMFAHAESFHGDISTWNVSHVVDMNGMFYAAKSFNCNLASWDVSRTVWMHDMFRKASSFESDLDNWDVSADTEMSNMFESATEMLQGPLPPWYKVEEEDN